MTHMSYKALWEGHPSKTYIIERILLDDLLARRLEALGMNEGTKVRILTKKRSGAMVIKLRGSRLALGRQITSSIEVSEFIPENEQLNIDKEAEQNG